MRTSEDFDSLFREHYGALLRYAGRRTDDEATASDVVAEVFTVAWRRLDELPEEALPWLIGTARRVIANRRRGESRVQTLHLRLRDHSSDTQDDFADVVCTADAWREALSQLSADDQELLALTAWDQLSPHEASVVLGCGIPAYRMRLSRARRRLRKHLQDADEGPAEPVTSGYHLSRSQS